MPRSPCTTAPGPSQAAASLPEGERGANCCSEAPIFKVCLSDSSQRQSPSNRFPWQPLGQSSCHQCLPDATSTSPMPPPPSFTQAPRGTTHSHPQPLHPSPRALGARRKTHSSCCPEIGILESRWNMLGSSFRPPRPCGMVFPPQGDAPLSFGSPGACLQTSCVPELSSDLAKSPLSWVYPHLT